MGKAKLGSPTFARDLALGGAIGAISKTVMSPVERVKILMQTMDSNPDVISGKVKPYSSIGDCFSRVSPEQGSALAFNDFFKNMFPKVDKQQQFWTFFTYN